MKIKPKDYAIVLVNAMIDSKSDHKEIMSNFSMLLEKNRDTHKIREIIFLAENIYAIKTGKHKILLETARRVDNKTMVNKFSKKGDFAEEKINPALIAGIKIIINNEKQLDFSLQKKLNEIF